MRWNSSGSDELMHFGIKGQKWGIRRFQYENGSYTEEGKRRYGVSESQKSQYKVEKQINSEYKKQIEKEKASGKAISKSRQAQIKKYVKKGYTQENAEIQALKREKTAKFVKAAGAIALTAALAYGAYKGAKYIQQYGDKVVPKGSPIYRVMGDKTESDDWTGYMVTDSNDATKYRGMLGAQILQRQAFGAAPDNGVWRMEGQAGSNIKIAGEKTGEKLFKKLKEEDPDFAKDVSSVLDEWKDFTSGCTEYESFNTALCDHTTPAALRVQEKFYGALKEKGYGGLIDVNDRRHSGYNTKNPYIVFNLGKQVANKKIEKMTKDEIRRDYERSRKLLEEESARQLSSEVMVGFAKKAVMYSTAFAVVGAASVKSLEKDSNRQAAQYRKVIDQYKKDHPNTKMSDQEILDSVYEDNK